MTTMLRNLHLLDVYRVSDPRHGWRGDEAHGAFLMPGPCGMNLRVIASGSEGWDHVSVSTPRRCPNWEEMQWIRVRFFRDEACVMQLHPPIAQHINCHPYCLHLWRPHDAEIPRPPPIFVGPTPKMMGERA